MKAEGKIWVFYDVQTKQQTKPLSLLQAQTMLLQFKMKDLENIFVWTPGWTEWSNLKQFLKTNQNYFVVAHPPRPQVRPEIKKEAPSEKPTSPTRVSIPEQAASKLFTQIDVNQRPKPQQKKDYGYWFNDFHGNELDISKINKIKPLKNEEAPHENLDEVTAVVETNGDDRRHSQRHNFKIEIVLINKQGSFRTFSKNISMTGTLLEDEIPKHYLKTPFDLMIINRFEPDIRRGRLLFKGKVVGDLTDPRRLTFIDADEQSLNKLEELLKAYVDYQNGIKRTS
ncbi:MAG: PilZ domain-containing protein [Bdellovibrionia bacterium]